MTHIDLFIDKISKKQDVSRKEKLVKKIMMLILIFCMLVCCLGCGESRKEEGKRKVGEFTLDINKIKANKVMAELWDYIERRDVASIMGIISEKTKREMEDCEGKVIEFLDAFEDGEIIEVVNGGGGGALRSSEYGKTTRYRVLGSYRIKTTKGVYKLNFGYVITNKSNPEEVGLNWIFLRPNDKGEYEGGGGYDICVYPFEE